MRPPSFRRLFAPLCAMAAVIALVAVPLTALAADDPDAAAPARPNVVVIMTDDMRADDLEVMPNVRGLLGAEGTTFDQAVVSYPLCCPSRATLLTGQYSHNHGVEFNRPPTGGYPAFDGTTALPVALQEAGYHTMHIGKYLNGYGTDDPLEVPPGWSDWRGSIDPSTYQYSGYTLNENGVLRTFSQYQTDRYARLARDLISGRAEEPEPFFLNLAFLAPHAQVGPGTPVEGGVTQPVPAAQYAGDFADEPLPTPPSFDEADVSDKPSFIADNPPLSESQIDGIAANHRARLETLQSVDDAVAGIVETLQATGQLDETVIVFTSDNGFFLGEHRVPNGKYFVYEESVRVPLLVRGPGVAEHAVQDTLVGNIDLAPTILELTGATPLVVPDGRSLVGLLADPTAAWDRDLLLETGENATNLPVYQALRTPRYVYVEHDTGERELYDLTRDPFQLHSLHDDPRLDELEDRLAAQLDALRDCRGTSCG